jgi:putative peptidoglycan lipid II flippase
MSAARNQLKSELRAAVDSAQLARRSVRVATWTTVSRATGFARSVAVAAILGPTFLANIYQGTNVLPNLAYEFLTGSLLATLLVPTLVRHADLGDDESIERIAGGFLGVALTAFALVTVAVVLLGPAVLRVLSAGVENSDIAAAQARVGWPLLAMLMPQVLLYGLAGTAQAVMNAHGRFSLAAAAPALENVGIIVTLGATALFFRAGTVLARVETPQLLLLGIGTTCAVGFHAAAQWWGARRLGVRLIPRAGWNDPDVRKLLGRTIPSLGYAGFNALRILCILIVANRISGGIVAFQLALNFFYLPIALAANPVAVAILPQLSRIYHDGNNRIFREELTRAAGLIAFFAVPAAVSCIVLSGPLANAFAFGEMASATGVAMIAASIAALGVGIVGESGFLLCTSAAYARHDVRAPFMAMLIRTGVSVAGMLIVFLWTDGIVSLAGLGLAVSCGNLLGAWHLWTGLTSTLPTGRKRLTPSLIRATCASLLMVGPSYVIAVSIPDRIEGQVGDLVGMLVAGLVGIGIFGLLQHEWHSPELRWLLGGLGAKWPRQNVQG